MKFTVVSYKNNIPDSHSLLLNIAQCKDYPSFKILCSAGIAILQAAHAL